MNDLEELARPILEPLIAGRPTVLNQNQQRSLAQWITMKVMVAEHNTPEDVVIPRADKELFKADRSIPRYITIWIGRHNVSAWCTTFSKHTASLSLTPFPPPAVLAGRKNIETIAFGIGALFVYVMVSDPDGQVNLNDLITVHHLPRLWPTLGTPILWGAIVLRGTADEEGWLSQDISPTSLPLSANPPDLGTGESGEIEWVSETIGTAPEEEGYLTQVTEPPLSLSANPTNICASVDANARTRRTDEPLWRRILPNSISFFKGR